MKLPHKAHVAIVDGENFVLMRNDGQLFEPKLSQVDKPKLTATNFSAGVKHQDDIGQRKGATDLDELAHATAAAEWLNAKAVAGEMDDLVVIADPKTLGEMRRHYHTELEKRLVGEIAKTLTGETTERIEKAISQA
ncbi:host attachment protein [Pontixanthobacter aestiaquae]|uniref:Attachment protein n=1 Tax=Pontixanthobacter aestiaquae TaxID=1509367 RepID=A0A844Z1S4_9SPHN|nr:host attachment protein [Pontixanthobacter aestiaquae]MDN3647139.1 host attachment protein [Pontixanthobacter aestiaquae]MXO81885.1 attachment protein [Pontixanthobacter aestiaquae]